MGRLYRIRNPLVRIGLWIERMGPWMGVGGLAGASIGFWLNPSLESPWLAALVALEFGLVLAIGLSAPIHKRLGLRKSDVVMSE